MGKIKRNSWERRNRGIAFYLENSCDLNSWFRGEYYFDPELKDGGICLADIYKKYKRSDHFKNGNIRAKLLKDLIALPICNKRYQERFRPYIDGIQKEYYHCFVGFRAIPQDDDEIIDDL